MYMHIYNDFILFYNCFFSLLCMYVCTYDYVLVGGWLLSTIRSDIVPQPLVAIP